MQIAKNILVYAPFAVVGAVFITVGYIYAFGMDREIVIGSVGVSIFVVLFIGLMIVDPDIVGSGTKGYQDFDDLTVRRVVKVGIVLVIASLLFLGAVTAQTAFADEPKKSQEESFAKEDNYDVVDLVWDLNGMVWIGLCVFVGLGAFSLFAIGMAHKPYD